MFGFELRTENGWDADACGHQSASNLLDARGAAESELPNLASVLGVDVSDLRVTEFELRAGEWRPVR